MISPQVFPLSGLTGRVRTMELYFVSNAYRGDLQSPTSARRRLVAGRLEASQDSRVRPGLVSMLAPEGIAELQLEEGAVGGGSSAQFFFRFL